MPNLPQMTMNDFLLLIGDQQVSIRRLTARVQELEASLRAKDKNVSAKEKKQNSTAKKAAPSAS